MGNGTVFALPYNYAEHLSERRRMMQAWADLLDQFRAAPDRAERLAA